MGSKPSGFWARALHVLHQPFLIFRESTSSTHLCSRGGGRGLHQGIVNQIIQLSSGWDKVNSLPGSGSEAHFCVEEEGTKEDILGWENGCHTILGRIYKFHGHSNQQWCINVRLNLNSETFQSRSTSNLTFEMTKISRCVNRSASV